MPRNVDVHVGKRIRHRRWLVGITQNELAEKIGVKFQQVQKYETGFNRVSASTLWEIARVLKISVSFFFKGLERNDREVDAIISDPDATKLIASYFKIPLVKRKAVLEFARALAETEILSKD